MDVQKVKEFLIEKERKEQREIDSRFSRAWEDTEKIISMIRSEFPVKRIYPWGYLLDRSTFSEISDIDIALEGVRSPEEFFAILGKAMDITDFPVDIVEIEQLKTETAKRIRKKGRLVYECKNY